MRGSRGDVVEAAATAQQFANDEKSPAVAKKVKSTRERAELPVSAHDANRTANAEESRYGVRTAMALVARLPFAAKEVPDASCVENDGRRVRSHRTCVVDLCVARRRAPIAVNTRREGSFPKWHHRRRDCVAAVRVDCVADRLDQPPPSRCAAAVVSRARAAEGYRLSPASFDDSSARRCG